MVAFGETREAENVPAVENGVQAAVQQEGSERLSSSRVRSAAAAFAAAPATCSESQPQLTRISSGGMSRVKAAAAALNAAAAAAPNGGTTPRGAEPGGVAAALARFRQVNEEASTRPPPVQLRHSTSVPSVAAAVAPKPPLGSSAAPSPREPASAEPASVSAPPTQPAVAMTRVASAPVTIDADSDASSSAPSAPAASSSSPANPDPADATAAPSKAPAEPAESRSAACEPGSAAPLTQNGVADTAEADERGSVPAADDDDASAAPPAAEAAGAGEQAGADGEAEGSELERTPTSADDAAAQGLAGGAAEAGDEAEAEERGALAGLRGKGLPVGMLSPDECIFSPAQRRKGGLSGAAQLFSPWQMAGAAAAASFTGQQAAASAGSSPGSGDGDADANDGASEDAPPSAAAAFEAVCADDLDDDVPCEIKMVDGVLLCTAHAARFQRLLEATAAVPVKRTGSRFDLLTDFAARKELESLCSEVADLEAEAAPTPAVLAKPPLLVGGRRMKQRRKKN